MKSTTHPTIETKTKLQKTRKKGKTKENKYNIARPCSNSTKQQNMQTITKKKLQTSPMQIISPAMCCPPLKGKKKVG